MTYFLTRRTILATLVALVSAPSLLRAQGTEKFETSKLAIISGTGRHEFNIELALTDRQQSQGLMFRQSLAPDAGMLFDYGTPSRISMWMKNTFIPLDMIFIGADGKVVRIAERTVPHSEELISSGRLARAVIEVNGGTAHRLGIKVGDRIESEALASKP